MTASQRYVLNTSFPHGGHLEYSMQGVLVPIQFMQYPSQMASPCRPQIHRLGLSNNIVSSALSRPTATTCLGFRHCKFVRVLTTSLINLLPSLNVTFFTPLQFQS
jgi:hypothetical protein